MTAAALMVFALTLFVAAGSPGPSIAALVARVLTDGLRNILPFLAAMWIGEVIWLSFAVGGLAAVAQTFAVFFTVMKVLGVAYLLFLAWKMWFSPTEARTDQLSIGQKPWQMFFAGMVVTLGNPKIMVFYLALVPTLIDLDRLDFLSWAELTVTMLTVLVTIDLRMGARRRPRETPSDEPSCGADSQQDQRRHDRGRGSCDRGEVTKFTTIFIPGDVVRIGLIASDCAGRLHIRKTPDTSAWQYG